MTIGTCGHHLHLPHFHVDDNRNLRLLYGVRVIRDIVNKITHLFFPVFLYEIGSKTELLSFLEYSPFKKGMLLIAAFYALGRLVRLPIVVWSGIVITKIGLSRALTISYVIRVLLFLLLYFVPEYPKLLIPVLFTDAIQTSLFWNAYFEILSKNTLKTNTGQDLGLLQFLLQIVAVVTPAITGAIAVLFGYHFLFLVGLIGPLISCSLTLLMDLYTPKDRVSFSEFFSWLKEWGYEKFALAYGGKTIQDVTLFLWPLYVFFLLGAVDSVGYVYTVSLFLALVCTFFIGTYIDKIKSRRPFQISGSIIAALWLVRTQVVGLWGVALADMADKLTSNFHWLYFDALHMKRGHGKESLSYFVYALTVSTIVEIPFWLLFGALFFFEIGWIPLFILAGVGAAASTLMHEDHG